ncbi:MAG: hypothetical protein M1825_002315 [Sarcosagium campestre]|nr:MAG: hypothetical protein M1825_002315 [Sarcosagium campestre]
MSYCGLYYIEPQSEWYSERYYLPQADLKSHTVILSSAYRTDLTQTFVSPIGSHIKEAKYTFPLYDGVSVVGFTCQIGSKTITSVIKDRSTAKTAFDDAVSRGESAGLFEQSLDASDVFTTSVGNIPANEKAIVKISYVGELKHDAEVDGLRFTIPTSIAPRYANAGSTALHGSRDSGHGQGNIDVVVDISMCAESNIRCVESPTHPIAVTLGSLSSENANDGSDFCKATARLALGNSELGKDFVLLVQAKNLVNPSATLENHSTHAGQSALMVTLVPKFALTPARPEIVFVVDRSGSMRGNISTLKKALLVFLKSLPVGVSFNICSFGSSYSFLWPRSKRYDENSLREAISHVKSFGANFGGTKMFEPLKATFEQRLKESSLEVVLLTDGQIWAQQALFDLINEECQQKETPVRVFSVGLGAGASHSLIEGIARAGNGFSQWAGENEKLDRKLVRMLKGALTPHVTDYILEMKYDESDTSEDFELIDHVPNVVDLKTTSRAADNSATPLETAKPKISLFDETADPDAAMDSEDRYAHLPTITTPHIIQAPHKMPPLFPFIRSTIYLLIAPVASQRNPKSVVLKGTSSQGPLELEIPIQYLENPGQTVHQLAARKAMLDLEEGRGWIQKVKTLEGDHIKEKLPSRWDDILEHHAVQLGVRYQVAGKWCSFIALERHEAEGEDGEKSPPSYTSVPINPPQPAKIQQQGDRHKAVPFGATVPGPVLPAPQSMSIPHSRQPGIVASVKRCAVPASMGARGKVQLFGASIPSSSPGGGAVRSPASFGQCSVGGGGGSSDREITLCHSLIGGGGNYCAPMPRMAATSITPTPFAGNLASVASTPSQRMHKVIELQSFSGEWALSVELIAALAISAEDANEALDKLVLPQSLDHATSKFVLATALAIRFLEVKVGEEKDTWELVVEKAKGWLADVGIVGDSETLVFGVAGGFFN